MAKAKKPLTPEQAEIKAMKKEKSSMGWTKFWAIVLALVLTVGVVFVGKTTADKALEAAGTNVSGTAGEGGGSTSDGDGDILLGGDDNILLGDDEAPAGDDPATPGDEAPAGDDPATPGDSSASDNDAAKPAYSKANAHEFFNNLTAGANKASYKFARVSNYTSDGAINVGGATFTKILDGIIKGIDENSSVDSVVGGFLGIGNINGEVKNGVIPEDMNAQYALKAMALTSADILAATVSGNTYKVQISNCSNPQKDGKNALSRATNDFFTHQEAADGIAGFTNAITLKSTDVQYTGIVLTAVVNGDALKTLEISYTLATTMTLQAGLSIKGTGKATNKITYTMM